MASLLDDLRSLRTQIEKARVTRDLKSFIRGLITVAVMAIIQLVV